MLELNVVFFGLAVSTVLFAGLSKGWFRGGAVFASTSILALMLRPEQASMLLMMDAASDRLFFGITYVALCFVESKLIWVALA